MIGTAGHELPLLEILLRLLMAFACGAVIGLNREFRRKPAGFRTFGLVSIGTAVIVLAMQLSGGSDAVSRVIQGVVTGIGFLGAGVIFRREHPHHKVTGLTTAAAVWLTAGRGVAAGLGEYVLASAGVLSGLLLLVLGSRFEHLITGRRTKGRPKPGDGDQNAP
jgi:putative Mg2+ transporter-C (MgtC) family protein